MAITLNDLIEYYEHQNWKYTVNEEGSYLTMRMNMQAVDASVCVTQTIGDMAMLCYVVFPIKVPEQCRVPVAEFICRANYGLHHGNFEMDMNDGEVRYKTTCMTTDQDPVDEAVIGRLIQLAFVMTDRYAPGILSVIYANDQPAQAVARVEQKAREEQEAQR